MQFKETINNGFKIYRKGPWEYDFYHIVTLNDPNETTYEDPDYVYDPLMGGSIRYAYYKIKAFDFGQNESNFSNMVSIKVNAGGSPLKQLVGSYGLALPKEFALSQNYPNPFNPATAFKYELPEDSFVELIIYDILGGEIRTLINSNQKAGFKNVMWDGKEKGGNYVSTGIYIYQFSANSLESAKKYHKTMKMVFLR